jgi:oligopeptide transport system substrate-binding protein
MAKARGLGGLLALCAAVAFLAGCGGSSGPKPPHGGAVLRLTLPLVPATLDPAKAADLPSLNVAHELYAGLTRFSGTGVEPDLAESWDVGEGGLVWTFHLRDGIRWSDDTPITAADFRRSWLRALAPKTAAPYAGPALGIVRGARHFHATGRGGLGVEAPDEHTLRVTLQHPVPWFDELAAFPIAAPTPPRPTAFSGPFRVVSRNAKRLVLERNVNYWNSEAVKPSRLVLSDATKNADAVLPSGLAGPGLPWIDTAGPAPSGAAELSTLATGLLWFVTRGTPLADRDARRFVAWVVTHLDLGTPLATLIPPEMPGAGTVNSRAPVLVRSPPRHLRLTLVWAESDAAGSKIAAELRRSGKQLRSFGIDLDLRPVRNIGELLGLAGPPARPGVDLVLLGWSSKIFDAYNLLDLFPCGSAFNVARWCDPSYDALMRQAVRTFNDEARWRIERRLVEKLHDGVPAIPVYTASDHFSLAPGVQGFSWSPIGFYELMGMTRS